jgi:hypothetical protein
MMISGVRWTDEDRQGNPIYLTEERWQHIVDRHKEMRLHEENLKECIRHGSRRQDSLNPQKYKYTKYSPNLPGRNTAIVAIVLFRFRENEIGEVVQNNFLATAYQKAMRR